MGLFDSVWGKCTCGGEVQWQSKAGECLLAHYSLNKIPANIALDLNGQIEKCNRCGKSYFVTCDIHLPQFVSMEIKEIENGK